MVSPGCTNCYAMRLAARLEAMGLEKYEGLTRRSGGRAVWTGRVTIDARALSAPLAWKLPRRIFVNSMSDLFQQAVPNDFIRAVWDVMRLAPQHTFQILTKRPERMPDVLSAIRAPLLPNVWLGTSVEGREQLPRIEALRRTPAAIRFVSFEPLITAVGEPDLSGVQWAIVGGESGPGARPMRPEWVEDIRRACRRQRVAFFFKQWGGANKKAAGRLLRGRTYDEYPRTTASVMP
jgi:protein gp37